MQLEHAIGFKKSVNIFEEDHCLPLPKELMGVELEVEGVRSNEPVPPLWREVPDDSLRNYGKEYIFNEPLYGSGVTDALMDMSIFMDKVQPDTTYRTSVHVHLNVSDMSVEELLTLLTLYLMFERTIVKYHKSREDNIFCIPYYKAPESLRSLVWLYDTAIKGELDSHHVGDLLDDFNKYSALNIKAIHTHGSLEFRHMAGCTDMVQVFEWIKIIQHLKRASLGTDIDYMELVKSASSSSSSLLEQVFQESAELLKYPNMTNDIMQGARLAQRVIHGSLVETLRDVERGRRNNQATTDKIQNIRASINSTADGTEIVEEQATIDPTPSPTTTARREISVEDIEDMMSFFDEVEQRRQINLEETE